MVAWWSISFLSGRLGSGYMKMQDGACVGVYLEDGTEVMPDEKVEYTCVQTDGVAPPSWA
jgi:hypothetical protein